jgi:predicted metal-dependent hydrolase
MSLDYKIKRSKRARKGSIVVTYTGEVIVTVPYLASTYLTDRFVQKRSEWIRKTQEHLKKKFENKNILKQSRQDFKNKKSAALRLVSERLKHFNAVYNLKINNIKIKNHASRWGSCSSKGNLNFNYTIINLPQELADYIIVHELCHLKELNHSKKFWDLVAIAIPNWKVLRKKLKHDYITIQ